MKNNGYEREIGFIRLFINEVCTIAVIVGRNGQSKLRAMRDRYGMLRKGLRKRRLAAAIGACLMVPSAALHALGMGDIDVHSSLNQPLNATIRLISVDQQELETLDVSLAPKAAFERMGLDRMPVLSKLDFQVVTENGTPVIKVTSKVPVREPFLDFILSVNWANGQMLREYTLLLDPPVFDKGEAAPAPIQAAATSPATIVRDAQEEFEQIATEEVRFTAGEGSYGPTKTTDTLWTVAKKMRPDPSVSVPQMMLALLKENPEAFIDNNVNNLKAGYILRAPDMETILALSRNQAAAEVNRQYQQWLQRKSGGASGGVGQRQIASGEGGSGAVDRTAGAAASAPQQAAAPEARLQLVSPEDAQFEGEVGGAVDGQVATLKQQLTLAMESVEVTRQENAELRARLAELEKQLANMQRLLTLQDGTMSALQGGLAQQEAEQQGLAEAGVETPQAEGVATPAEEAPATTEGTPAGTAASPEGMEVAAGQPSAQPEEAKQEPKAPPVPAAAPKPESSFIDDLMANPNTLLVGGGVGALALLLVAMMMRRRRQTAEEDLFDAPLAPAAAGAAAAGAVAGAAAAESEPAREQKGTTTGGGFVEHDEDDGLGEAVADIDDYTGFGDDLGTIHAEESEIDPIAEADVYLAYRRYEQAESLLKEAIQNDEERHELKLKLMEIYHTTKDKEAFEAQAEALYAALGGEEDGLWQQAVEMGRDLCPDHPLFTESGAVLEEGEDGVLDLSESTQEQAESPSDDIDFESLAEPEPAPEQGEGGSAEFELGELEGETSQSFDLDLDLDQPPTQEGDLDLSAEGASTPEVAETGGGELDLDLDQLASSEEFDLKLDDELNLDEPATTPEAEQGVELDLDLDQALTEPAEASTSPDGMETDLTSLSAQDDFSDLDLDSLDDEVARNEEPVIEGLNEEGALDLDGLDLDLDQSAAEAEQVVAQESDSASAEPAEAAGQAPEVSEMLPELDDLGELDNIVNFEAPESSSGNDTFDLSTSELEGLDSDLDDLAATLGKEADEMGAGLAAGESSDSASQKAGDSNDWEIEPAISSFGESEEEYSLFESTDDVVGTKLDLAKAYIDMGDQDGARSILDEVVKEGSDTQRQEAEQLMRQIG